MNSIIDHNQRQRAIQPEHSFIVQAPAGSGKTELLIQRYLKLLSLVEQPEEIIAITFTRKAAAEMQGRVLRALQSADSKTEPEKEHHRITFRLASQALKQDQEKQWSLLNYPARLRIQTIDSLCGSLIRQMPVLSQMGAHSEVAENAEPLYQQAALRALESINRDQPGSNAVKQLLRHLDNDLPRVQRLLVGMLHKRDQWLRHIAGSPDRRHLESGFKRLITHHLKPLHAMFPKECVQELCELGQYAAQNLCEQEKNSAIQQCLEMDDLPGFNADDREQWLGIRELLLKADGHWRAAHNINQGFLPPAEGTADEKALKKSMKQRIKGLIAKISETNGLELALDTTYLLPAAEYHDEEWQIVKAMCDVLVLAAAQLQLIFAETGTMDFSAVSSAAIQALGTEDEPSDLALHLDYQIHHILVDEFQDISHSQYLLLKGLTAAWDLSTNKSLFLVGDPMQSIYRFREAEVRLFIDAWQNRCLGSVPLQCLRLQSNFRSTISIINWINSQFVSIMPPNSDSEAGAVAYSASKAVHEDRYQDAIQVLPQFDSNGLNEAEQLTGIIRNIQQNHPEDTIAVLARGRSHLVVLMRYLQDANISFQAIEIEGFVNQPCIQDLVALCRACLHRADRTAWLAVLRAPWCGLELQTLLELFGNDKDKTIWQCMNNEERLSKLSREERKRLIKFRDIVRSAMDSCKKQGLRRLIESLWLRLGGPATLTSESELDNCLEFFQFLDEIDDGDFIDTKSLIEAMSKLHVAVDTHADGALQLMTMHKSKGLEFDHVILPGLGKKPPNQQHELLLWALRLDGIYEDLIMAPIHQTGIKDNPVYEYLKSVEKHKRRYEDARLLYVACTRARHRLYLSGHVKPEASKDNHSDITLRHEPRSLLSLLWPSISIDFEKVYRQLDMTEEEELVTVVKQALRRLKSDWKMPSFEKIYLNQGNIVSNEPFAELEFDWATESIMHIGTVVHQNLERISDDGIENWNIQRIRASSSLYWKQLKLLGVEPGEKEYCCLQVQKALSNTLEDPLGRWILSHKHQQIQNEYALSGFFENQLTHIRIDRTFIDKDNRRWIIDYKTSRHDEADQEVFLDQQIERYRSQLKKYRDLFVSMEQREIHTALYFPLLKAFREVTFQ